MDWMRFCHRYTFVRECQGNGQGNGPGIRGAMNYRFGCEPSLLPHTYVDVGIWADGTSTIPLDEFPTTAAT